MGIPHQYAEVLFAVGLGRDHVDSALFPDHVPDPVRVICFVCEHVLTRLQVVEQRLARRRVMSLTGCQFISDWKPILIGILGVIEGPNFPGLTRLLRSTQVSA